ncbi:MAG: nucleotidyl transferase AbiEii/AbiGii toxin family protein, partial [Thermoplasmata archaeon]|nr:nucleotidyl transferase AbiEii/AbiGii toxin family protein [Thermoplasmata archaeon]
KLRVGEAGSRFTPDLDVARSANLTLEDYVTQLGDRLAEGWSGFTGTVLELDSPQPEAVPEDYVMQPFEVRLAYRSRHWLTVPFELGRDEVGSTHRHELRIAGDIVGLFEALGLGRPAPVPVPVLAVDHQVAQKLHACTAVNPRTGRNERAHDLVDLQILDQDEKIDPGAVAVTGERLFAARRTHPWPPTVVAYDGWATIYAEAADGLDVIHNVDDAVAWANDLLARATGWSDSQKA